MAAKYRQGTGPSRPNWHDPAGRGKGESFGTPPSTLERTPATQHNGSEPQRKERQTLHIHVVNLDRSPERITEFCSVNRNITATVARFVAVDGRKLHVDQLVQRGLVTKDVMSMFSVGALGCAMSNIALWDIAIASGQAVTTCEDDAILNDRFNECAEALLKTLPLGWDIIFWGYNFDMFMSFELLPFGAAFAIALLSIVPLLHLAEPKIARERPPHAYAAARTGQGRGEGSARRVCPRSVGPAGQWEKARPSRPRELSSNRGILWNARVAVATPVRISPRPSASACRDSTVARPLTAEPTRASEHRRNRRRARTVRLF